MMDLELFRCAEINLESVAKDNPIFRMHPLFVIAMNQLKAAIEKAEKEGVNDGNRRKATRA